MPKTFAESFKTFVDASGAPAVIEVQGFFFSFDCLGGPTDPHLLNTTNRSPSKRVVALAAWKYHQLLEGLTPEWHAANRAMYTEDPTYT